MKGPILLNGDPTGNRTRATSVKGFFFLLFCSTFKLVGHVMLNLLLKLLVVCNVSQHVQDQRQADDH
jgi:hypothetical protein